MCNFYDIKVFAAQHFFSWETGEDFDWLKKEWHKFKPHLKDTSEAEDFILSLAYIYFAFTFESYFLKCKEGIATVEDYIAESAISIHDVKSRIENKLDFTLDILLKVYTRPEEVLREIVSIAINFEIPHPDGYEYIKGLFKDKYVTPEIFPNSIKANYKIYPF